MILLHGISAGSSAMMKLLLALFLAGCAGVGEELPETVAMEDPTVVAEWIWTDGQMAWGGWGEQLLALAQREDRPILIYLAAPGCEGLFPAPTSGLNQLIAENFVSVRVDPFKRPDIARYYDSGGWPALLAALPDGRVFARAVDIPPANVEPYLRRLYLAYEEKRGIIVDKVRRVGGEREAQASFEVAAVYRACVAAYDSTYGGFGGPSKFLETSVLRFLLAYADEHDEQSARRMALHSLDAILDSPLYAKGAFYAYSATPDWNAPVREIDALDQAAMLHLLLEAGQPRYLGAARELLGFIEGEFFAVDEGFFRGRRIDAEQQWTDPTFYADRQAALIRACLAASTVLEDDRAKRLALQAGDALLAHCIDDNGGVRHVCGAQHTDVSGLLVDQALAALALWELGQVSGEVRFADAVDRVARYMEDRLGGPVAFYNRAEPVGPLPRFFSHRDTGRPAGNALALSFYGRRGDIERSSTLAGGLRIVPDRAYGSWARAVLRYGGMEKSSL
jgi:uncharacterized protein YyaL (SSP411 family)